jgi:hypothetical protein
MGVRSSKLSSANRKSAIPNLKSEGSTERVGESGSGAMGVSREQKAVSSKNKEIA